MSISDKINMAGATVMISTHLKNLGRLHRDAKPPRDREQLKTIMQTYMLP